MRWGKWERKEKIKGNKGDVKWSRWFQMRKAEKRKVS